MNKNRFSTKLVYKNYNNIVFIFIFYKFFKIYSNILPKSIKY